MADDPAPFLELTLDTGSGDDLVDYFHLDTHRSSDGQTTHKIGREVESWRREKRPLGQGGFGTAWLEKEFGGRFRVVKEVKKAIPGVSEKYWFRELQALALLSKNKDCFPHYYGWFQDSEYVSISMEYFGHGDLIQCVREALPEEQGQSIIIQLSQALRFMHHKCITHRDLKPNNVLVRQPGPQWHVVISDFGVSKRVRDASTALQTSFQGDFMAPEILGIIDDDTSGEYTNAVDAWSLGCLTYWLLHHKIPVQRRNLWNHCLRPWDQAAAKIEMPNVAADAKDFILCLLRPSPNDRMSAAQACTHPWLSVNTDSVAAGFSKPNDVLGESKKGPLLDQLKTTKWTASSVDDRSDSRLLRSEVLDPTDRQKSVTVERKLLVHTPANVHIKNGKTYYEQAPQSATQNLIGCTPDRAYKVTGSPVKTPNVLKQIFDDAPKQRTVTDFMVVPNGRRELTQPGTSDERQYTANKRLHADTGDEVRGIYSEVTSDEQIGSISRIGGGAVGEKPQYSISRLGTRGSHTQPSLYTCASYSEPFSPYTPLSATPLCLTGGGNSSKSIQQGPLKSFQQNDRGMSLKDSTWLSYLDNDAPVIQDVSLGSYSRPTRAERNQSSESPKLVRHSHVAPPVYSRTLLHEAIQTTAQMRNGISPSSHDHDMGATRLANARRVFMNNVVTSEHTKENTSNQGHTAESVRDKEVETAASTGLQLLIQRTGNRMLIIDWVFPLRSEFCIAKGSMVSVMPCELNGEHSWTTTAYGKVALPQKILLDEGRLYGRLDDTPSNLSFWGIYPEFSSTKMFVHDWEIMLNKLKMKAGLLGSEGLNATLRGKLGFLEQNIFDVEATMTFLANYILHGGDFAGRGTQLRALRLMSDIRDIWIRHVDRNAKWVKPWKWESPGWEPPTKDQRRLN